MLTTSKLLPTTTTTTNTINFFFHFIFIEKISFQKSFQCWFISLHCVVRLSTLNIYLLPDTKSSLLETRSRMEMFHLSSMVITCVCARKLFCKNWFHFNYIWTKTIRFFFLWIRFIEKLFIGWIFFSCGRVQLMLWYKWE